MMDLVRRATAVLAVSALFLMTGCGSFWVYPGSSSSGSGSTSGDIVYVANEIAGTVSGFVVSAGTLTAVAGTPLLLGLTPSALAVNPADSILFVASNNEIDDYSITSGGVLSVLVSGAALNLIDVVAMDISPDGQWLFALDGSLGSTIVSLYEFQIDSSTGTLTPWPTSVGGVYSYAITTAAPTPTPSAIKVSPDGTFVFVALGTGGDLAIPFTTASGLLATPTQMTLASLPQYTSDNALAVNSSSTILYIARSSSASKGVVAAYSIGAGGLLSLEAEGTTGVYPTAVVLNSAGTDVYVANRTDGTISGFSTTASGGVLSPLGGSPYSSGSLVDALAVDNSGDYLLTASFGGSSDLTMYSYDSTTAGKLDISAATSTGTDPTGPIAIATTH